MRYFISLGSNLGDRAANVRAGADALRTLPGAVVALSPIEITAPMYVTDQPSFANAVARVDVALEPHAMLDTILDIEQRHGRVRDTRFGPRTLDLDIVAAEDVVVDSERLQIPHPRMHERAFVLSPMATLDATWRHPILGRTVAELLAALDEPAEVA